MRDEAGERVIAARRVTIAQPDLGSRTAARGDDGSRRVCSTRPISTPPMDLSTRSGRAQIDPQFRLSRSLLAHDRRERPGRRRARDRGRAARISSRASLADRSRRGATPTSRSRSSNCAFSSRPICARSRSNVPDGIRRRGRTRTPARSKSIGCRRDEPGISRILQSRTFAPARAGRRVRAGISRRRRAPRRPDRPTGSIR